MSYKLQKPYTDIQRADFIVKYNHTLKLRTEESEQALYALEAWETLDGDTVIDNTEAWQTKQFEIAKAEKITENETKRNVEYITTSIGQLKTQTPLGDLKTAIPLFDKIAAANGGLPAGAVRLYDSEGNVTLSPALTFEQYQALTVEVAMAYVAIDAKSTAYTQAIMQAQDMDELEAIVIDYATSTQEETEAPNATGAGTTGTGSAL